MPHQVFGLTEITEGVLNEIGKVDILDFLV
jgi:hypothetical protein